MEKADLQARYEPSLHYGAMVCTDLMLTVIAQQMSDTPNTCIAIYSTLYELAKGSLGGGTERYMLL